MCNSWFVVVVFFFCLRLPQPDVFHYQVANLNRATEVLFKCKDDRQVKLSLLTWDAAVSTGSGLLANYLAAGIVVQVGRARQNTSLMTVKALRQWHAENHFEMKGQRSGTASKKDLVDSYDKELK